MKNNCCSLPDNIVTDSVCSDKYENKKQSLRLTNNNFKEVYGYDFSEFAKKIKKAKDLSITLIEINNCEFTHLCKIRSKKGNADFKVVADFV